MARISRKELKRDEFLEATKDAENWLEENWQLVLRIVAVVVVVVIVVWGWIWYGNRSREQAAELLQAGLKDFNAAQLGGFADTSALENALPDFESAARKGGSASVGLVGQYYRGVTLHHLGRDEEATEALQKVADNTSAPETLRGSAGAVLAEVYADLGDQDRAVATLQGLIDADPPIYPVDQAMLELAELYNEAGDTERAGELWRRIVDEYPARGAADEARRMLGS